MEKKRKPEFKNEDEERAFWSEHDSTEYVDWSKARLAEFPNLKPSKEASNQNSGDRHDPSCPS